MSNKELLNLIERMAGQAVDGAEPKATMKPKKKTHTGQNSSKTEDKGQTNK